MWSNKISNIILSYYKEFYMQHERKYYEPNIEVLINKDIPFVIGGERGLKLILNSTDNTYEPYILYSHNYVECARMIANNFYSVTNNPLISVNTSIPYKELTVDCGQRNIATVYTNLTTIRTAIKMKMKTLNDKTYDILVQSPRLYIIEVLHNYYNPIMFNKRNENRELLELLINFFTINPEYKLIEGKNEYNSGRAIAFDYLNIITNHKNMDKYIFKHIVVYCGNNRLILIGDMDIDHEVIELTKITGNKTIIHEMHLPGDLFVHKCISTLKMNNNKYAFVSVYNIGFYDLIPFTYNREKNIKIALPSVIARICMMEDNSGYDLLHNGKMTKYNTIMQKQFLVDALKETYPEPNDNYFYGQYIDKLTLKKHMISNISSENKIRPYHPYLNVV